MTNKLPEVGKRYKHIIRVIRTITDLPPDIVDGMERRKENEFICFECPFGEEAYEMINAENCMVKIKIQKKDFWDYFEELPEEKAEHTYCKTSKRSSFNTMPLSELLRREAEVQVSDNTLLNSECFECGSEITLGFSFCNEECMADFHSNKCPVEKECVKEEPKTIWKDVSELPERTGNVIVIPSDGKRKIMAHYYSDDREFRPLHDNLSIIPCSDIQKYCSFTDFINEHNDMREELRDMKERLSKLESIFSAKANDK